MTLLLTYIFALLALFAVGTSVAMLVSPRVADALRPHAVGAASAVTGTATMGSLYLSEVAGYVPCELCWVQRIFMYSLSIITLTGLLKRRADALLYAVPLAVFGLAVSIWHVIVQRLPAAGGTCDPNNPCSAIYVERFGFMTIPTMAGMGFIAVLALAWIARSRSGDPAPTTTTSEKLEETVS